MSHFSIDEVEELLPLFDRKLGPVMLNIYFRRTMSTFEQDAQYFDPKKELICSYSMDWVRFSKEMFSDMGSQWPVLPGRKEIVVFSGGEYVACLEQKDNDRKTSIPLDLIYPPGFINQIM